MKARGKKQVIGRGKRKFYLLLNRCLFALSAGIALVLICNSRITVECNGRVYSQSITPFTQRDSFEDSDLFHRILEEEVRSVTRMAVIKSQLETDGIYNGQRQIDIAQYAHRQEELPAATATAPFLLDELVKWGNFGFVTETVYGTEADFNSYFQDGNSIFSFQEEQIMAGWARQSTQVKTMYKSLVIDQANEALSMRMISELPSSREEYLRRAEEISLYVEEEDILALNVLVPRYLSAEGRDLAEYASNVTEYVGLREDLKTTSKELFYNFTEYSEKKNQYEAAGCNVRYCYRMTVDGEVRYFTNLDLDPSTKLEEVNELFQSFGPYISYIGDRSEIDTNTDLTAEDMKKELTSYQYAFGDNTRVWLAIDTAYPAHDAFRKAKEAYESILPYYWYLAGGLFVLATIGLSLMIRLTRFEGREVDAQGAGYRIVLHRSDRMPTEPFLVVYGLFAVGIIFSCLWGYKFCSTEWEEALHSYWLPILFGIVMFAADSVMMFFYLSFVRRIKGRVLWKNSWTYLLITKLRKGVLSLYDNSHILLRTLVPFMGLLLANLVLGACRVWGILLAAVLDVTAILVLYRQKRALEKVLDSTLRFGRGDFDLKIDVESMHGENRALADAVNGLGDGIKAAVEQSMKDERLKTDLITNVSHDIKTPLTSIINFVNLLKREKIENERVQGYISVLEAKSQRLKQLTDDLVEASKITSGNISLQMETLNFTELLHQTCGEFSDKFREKCLEMILNVPENPVYIQADSRRIWRVVENLFSNAWKYALEGTRVYMDLKIVKQAEGKQAVFSMKNISAQSLNIDADELTERFIRGDVSRSTEGSGLGLSIAQELTRLQNGRFEIYLDGDLFKVILTFPSLDGEA